MLREGWPEASFSFEIILKLPEEKTPIEIDKISEETFKVVFMVNPGLR